MKFIIEWIKSLWSVLDLSQSVFYVEHIKSDHYDREIDEGMSSGMQRYVTLDITKWSKRDITKYIKTLSDKLVSLHMCKIMQIGCFNKDGKRYLLVSGESHALYISDTTILILRIALEASKIGVLLTYAENTITPPECDEYNSLDEKKYKSIDLGPYGSTGAPMKKIAIHPDAEKLREKGLIR